MKGYILKKNLSHILTKNSIKIIYMSMGKFSLYKGHLSNFIIINLIYFT